MPNSPEYRGVLGQAQHPYGFPIFLTRFGPMQFLPVSQADGHIDAEEISRHHRDTTEEYNMVAAGSPKQACDIWIKKWKDYWNQCVYSSGSYFDNSD
jgi:hypothetical protein